MNDTNPLTGLPGNHAIRKVLQRDVLGGSHQAVYVDIINFKPFNDHYGFAVGDAVIRRLGLVLRESLREGFVGHIGGDDFICTGAKDGFREAVEGARQRFRSIVPGFYSSRDRDQGGIETFDRRGSYRFFPMLDVSLVFPCDYSSFRTVEELAACAGREKKMLKGEQLQDPVSPVLRDAIESELPLQDKKALIEACGVLREEEAVPILDSVLKGSYSWNLRKSAALALGHIGSAGCEQILLRSLDDSNPHVRTRSVEGLVLATGSRAGPLIERLFSDSSTWVRRAVFRGIGQAGWLPGSTILERAARATAPGRRMNTVEERRAALEGIAMLADVNQAGFLRTLCREEGYYPSESAFTALCALGTDIAAEEILSAGGGLPSVVNLFAVGSENLRELEKLAVKSLSGSEKHAAGSLRFYEGFPGELNPESVSALKKSLGGFYGELFRRAVLLLESRNIPADRSCLARVANRLERGQRIGDDGLCAFLRWVSVKGGVSPGSLLNSFLRSRRRPVAASAAIAAGVLARGDLTRRKNR